jgi:hypothetical protein
MASSNLSPVAIETHRTFLHYTAWIVLFNSLFYYLIAYVLIFILTSLSSVVMASVFGISTIISKDQFTFLTSRGSWSMDAVISIFGTAPFISLLTALGLLVLYEFKASCNSSIRILLAWMIILCFTNFFGGIILGAFLNRGFGYIFMYLYIMDTGKVIITIICMMMSFIIGQALSRFFLFTANVYYNELRGGDKVRFGIFQFLIPFIFGNIVIGLFNFPTLNQDSIFLRISALLILIPLLIGCSTTSDLYFYEQPGLPSLAISPAFIALFLLLMGRLVLGEGIIL